MNESDRLRIEKDAEEYVDNFNNIACKSACYIAGATSEHKLLKPQLEYADNIIKKLSDELKSIKNQLWKPDPLCPHCKGSGGVQTGENEYSTCPCVEPKK